MNIYILFISLKSVHYIIKADSPSEANKILKAQGYNFKSIRIMLLSDYFDIYNTHNLMKVA